jgi:hypothetical protein
MMTMQIMNTACESREIAQTMKAAITSVFVDEVIVRFGRSCLVLMNPSSIADATADKIPNTPPNPANK